MSTGVLGEGRWWHRSPPGPCGTVPTCTYSLSLDLPEIGLARLEMAVGDVIDKHRLQRLLSVPARARASYVAPLLRAATVARYPQLLLRAARARARPAR
jgi:hypothetical protein